MMSMEQDHYGVLELEPGSPMEDVKSQYRRLAKLCHPDLHGDDARCAEQFRRVNAAYTFLSDAPRKAAYDAVLQAARKAGAPPLSFAPPKATPSPVTTAHQAPVTPAGFPEGPGDSIRMTRSAWLGATAGAVVVLLVIGLSLNGSGPSRPANVGVSSPLPTGGASGAPLADTRGNGSERRDGPELGADTDTADSSPADSSPAGPPVAPPAYPAADAAPTPRLRVPLSTPPFKAPVGPGITGGVWTMPHADATVAAPTGADPAATDPTRALRRRLLARYHAVLPRADRLLGRGYAVRMAGQETEDGSRHLLRDQLMADLADLSAARARLRPALIRLSQRDTPEQIRQEAGPMLRDLARLEAAGKPVRDDIKALAEAPAAPRPSRVAFHFSPLIPMRSGAPPPDPAPVPAPAVASAISPPPSPPAKPAPEPEVKPKTQADSGHEFILWGSK